LELAKQIAAVGGNPQDALATGTFAPGNLDDDTGKGNTCDTLEVNGVGCIDSLNLRVDDATADEITAAVAGISTGTDSGNPVVAIAASSSVSTSIAPTSTGTECSFVTVTVTSTIGAAAQTTTSVAAGTTTTPAGTASSTTAAPPANTTPASGGQNLQTFTGSLGGAPPPVVTSAKGFETDNSEFVNLAAAIGRSCDVQHNACANAANSGGQSFTVNDCDQQDTTCKANGGD